jgi:hypothetical protein
MKFLKKWIALGLICSTAACGPTDESHSKLKMDPATLYATAQVAFAVAGAVKGSMDERANMRQMKRLSHQIREARDAIIRTMQDIYVNDVIVQELAFVDDLRTFESWHDDKNFVNEKISEGNLIRLRLANVIKTMGTEQALRSVPALNLITATNAALMEYRGDSFSVIEQDLKELGAINYSVMEKQLPDRWYSRILAQRPSLAGRGKIEAPGLFVLLDLQWHDVITLQLQAAKIASQSDPLFSDIVAFQRSLGQMVHIQERPHYGLSGYVVLNGNTMTKGDGNGNICIFQTPQHLNLDNDGPVVKSRHLTQAGINLHVLTNHCKVKIPEGTFKMPGSNRVFYSNGVGAYCRLGHDAGAPMVVYDFEIDRSTNFAYHGNCQ